MSSLIRQTLYHFATDFDCLLLQLVENDIANILFKYRASYRQLIFIIETFELLMENSAKFYLFVNTECAAECSL